MKWLLLRSIHHKADLSLVIKKKTLGVWSQTLGPLVLEVSVVTRHAQEEFRDGSYFLERSNTIFWSHCWHWSLAGLPRENLQKELMKRYWTYYLEVRTSEILQTTGWCETQGVLWCIFYSHRLCSQTLESGIWKVFAPKHLLMHRIINMCGLEKLLLWEVQYQTVLCLQLFKIAFSPILA